MKHMAIGVPISRLFDWRTVTTLVHATAEGYASGYQMHLISAGNHERAKPIEQARNEIVEGALAAGCEWLLFIDSDATAKAGALTRLLSRNKPFISALAFKRKKHVTPACGISDGTGHYPPPVEEVIHFLEAHMEMFTGGAALLNEPDPDALLPVDAMGDHYTLIHRDVLTSMEPPWFVRTTEPDVGSTGSDWYFCEQARAAGFQPYVDLSVIAGHLTTGWNIEARDFLAWSMYYKWQQQFKEA